MKRYFFTIIMLLSASVVTADDLPIGFSVLGTTVPAGTENIPIPGGFTEVLPTTNMTLPTLTPEEISRGYLVFTTNYLQPVYSYTRPLRAEIGNQVSMFSAPNEYEPTTFSIHALQAMTNVTVAAGDLTGPGDNIAAINIDIRTVRCMPRRVWALPQYTIRPTLLEKRASVNIPADKTQQYWITVWVPPGKKPGIYTGVLTIQAVGKADYTVHISLEVLGLELLNSDVVYGMYYMSRDLSQPNYPPLPYEYLYKDTINMREHGMNTLFNAYPPTCSSYLQYGRMKYNVTPLNPLRDAILAAGFPRVIDNMTLGEIIQNPMGTFSTMLKAYVESLNAAGWPEIICSHGDESDAAGTYSTVNSWLATSKSVLPNNLTFTTIVFPENSEKYTYLDIRAFSSYADQSATIKTKAAGKQMYIYSGIPDYGLNPKGDRFYRGIWTVSMELDGAMQWIYFEAMADPTQPFNDLIPANTRPNWSCWVFPGPDGPLPSPGWEGVREGVEDQKYIFTLRSLIEDANQLGNPYLNALVQNARTLLNTVLNDVNNSPRESNSVFVATRESNKEPFSNYDFYNEFRRQMADYIMLISNAMHRLSSDGTLLAGRTIAIDGNMADWTSEMLVGTDADDPNEWYSNAEDLRNFYLANDGIYLYGRFTTVVIPNNQKIWFALDTDNDPCSGSGYVFNGSFGQNGCEAVVSMLLGYDPCSSPPYPDNPGGGVRNAFVDVNNNSGGWTDMTPSGIWHRTDSSAGSEFRVPLATLGITADTTIRWSAACASSDVFGGTRWSDMGNPMTQEYTVALTQPAACEEVFAAGWGLTTDFNKDCKVNFEDFAVLAEQWFRCNNPADAACERPWQWW